MSQKFWIFLLLLPSSFANAAMPKWLASAVPNSVAVDASSQQTIVELDNRDPLVSKEEPISDSLGKAFRFLGSVSFGNLMSPKDLKKDGFRFQFSPLFTFAYNRLSFPSEAAFFANTDFKIFRVSGGLGPEMNWVDRGGVYYLSLAPGLMYSWVDYSSPVDGGAVEQAGVTVTITGGYYRFITESLAVKFSVKWIKEDKELWDVAMDNSQGFDVPVNSVIQSIVSLSLCYYFDAVHSRIMN